MNRKAIKSRSCLAHLEVCYDLVETVLRTLGLPCACNMFSEKFLFPPVLTVFILPLKLPLLHSESFMLICTMLGARSIKVHKTQLLSQSSLCCIGESRHHWPLQTAVSAHRFPQELKVHGAEVRGVESSLIHKEVEKWFQESAHRSLGEHKKVGR